MKTYDVKCPHCGTENKGLYLEETNGWMECEYCGQSAHVMDFQEFVRLPIIEIGKIPLHVLSAKTS